jgi:Tfp pilus assembly protein PilO
MVVIAHYDKASEFLSDVASLRRIMVPYEVSITRAIPSAVKTFGDTTGALTQTTFQLRTFIKVGAAADTAGARQP